MIIHASPNRRRRPYFDGLNLVTVFVDFIRITELDTNELEPARVIQWRGDVDLGAVHANKQSAFFFRNAEITRFIRAHRGQGINQPRSVLHSAGTAPTTSIAWVSGAFRCVM